MKLKAEDGKQQNRLSQKQDPPEPGGSNIWLVCFSFPLNSKWYLLLFFPDSAGFSKI